MIVILRLVNIVIVFIIIVVSLDFINKESIGLFDLIVEFGGLSLNIL